VKGSYNGRGRVVVQCATVDVPCTDALGVGGGGGGCGGVSCSHRTGYVQWSGGRALFGGRPVHRPRPTVASPVFRGGVALPATAHGPQPDPAQNYIAKRPKRHAKKKRKDSTVK
jgi:hypothetical protein